MLHQSNAAGEGGQVEQRAIHDDSAQPLAQHNRQQQRAGDGERDAEHQVCGVDRVQPEVAILEQLDEVAQGDPLESDGSVEMPVRYGYHQREQHRARGEDAEAD